MENLIWLLKRIRPYSFLLVLSVVGSLLQSSGASAVALLVKGIIDDVFLFKNEEELVKTVLMLLGSAILMQGGFFLSKYTVVLASEKTLQDIRTEIFQKLMFIPYGFFIRQPVGDIISRIVSDVERIRQILVDQIPTILREPFVGIALFGVLIYRDPVLTSFLLIAVPLMAFMVKFFGGRKGKHVKKTQEKTGDLTQVLSQSLHGIENVKVFSAEDRLLSFFKDFNRGIYKSSAKAEFYVVGNTALNYIFGYTVTAAVIFYGGYRILEGDLTPGDFISYLTALFMIQPPLLNTQKALMNLKGSLPVINRLKELLEMKEETSGGIHFDGFKDSIEFREVKVKIENKEILKGINLTVKRGEKIGIVGHTGSGKSTLVKIIPHLVDYEGSVILDGIELRDLDVKSLRNRIGMSTQETFLLNASVRENMLIAKPNASEEEIHEALHLAVCDFVYRLEKGIDTVVGERGHSLSGGERQRLAIARLFLKNPDILILDEATSALDMETEKLVLNNIWKFFKGKTLFVVAHRISNITECDRIIVMKEGRVVEEGDFKSLSAKGQEFFRLFRNSNML